MAIVAGLPARRRGQPAQLLIEAVYWLDFALPIVAAPRLPAPPSWPPRSTSRLTDHAAINRTAAWTASGGVL